MRIVPSTILVALCLLLAAALGARWINQDPKWNPPAPQTSPDTLFLTLSPHATAPSAADKEPNALTEIASRPLFNPGRRPTEGTNAPTLATEVGDVALIGVFSTESTGGAILMIDGEARRMRTGERIGGLTLLAIDDTRARFIAADGIGFELELQRRLLPQIAAPDAVDGAPPPVTADGLEDEFD